MADKPRVSVILTSFNHARYLRESIESVLGQTFRDFELMIWDDGSTDDSWNIISSYRDPRIRAFRNRSQTGGAYIRKAILKVAAGGTIAIHHSDDVWEPQKLEKQVDYLSKHPETGAVFTWASIIDDDGQPFKDESHFYYRIFEQPNRTRFEWLNYFFYHANALCHPSVLIRKACYRECGVYRSGFAQLPDLDMWVRLCMKYEIHVLPEKLVRFRVRRDEQNVSGDRPSARIRHQFEFWRILGNYRSIPTVADLARIFPVAAKYLTEGDAHGDFALAMLSIEERENPLVQLFGLTILFELLNTPSQARMLAELHEFTNLDFLELTARYDVFSVERLRRLSAQLAEQQRELSETSERAREGARETETLRSELAEKQRAVDALGKEAAAGRQAIESLSGRLGELEQQIGEARSEAATLLQQVHERDAKVSDLTARLGEGEAKVSALAARLGEREAEFSNLVGGLSERDSRIVDLAGQLAREQGRTQGLTAELAEITESDAWKAAGLLKAVGARVAPSGSLLARTTSLVVRRMARDRDRRRIRRAGEDLRLIRASELFDEEWYVRKNPDVKAAGMDPAEHYLLFGGFELRDPGPEFSSRWYLERYGDVKSAGINPLVHYIRHGKREGRVATPLTRDVEEAYPAANGHVGRGRNPVILPFVHLLRAALLRLEGTLRSGRLAPLRTRFAPPGGRAARALRRASDAAHRWMQKEEQDGLAPGGSGDDAWLDDECLGLISDLRG